MNQFRLTLFATLLIACIGLLPKHGHTQSSNEFDIIKTAAQLEWSNPDSSIIILKHELRRQENLGNQLGSANLSLAISKTYNQRRVCDSIRIWLERASLIYDQLADERGQAEVLFQKGFDAFCRMEYEAALKNILEGQNIMEQLGDEAGMALGHLRMSRVFHFTSKMAESAKYGRLAAPRFEKIKDFANAWDSWSFAGHGYRMTNDSVQALECFENGMKMALETGLIPIKGFAYNDLASFYNEQDRYDSASVYFQKALNLVDPEDERQIMVTKNGLGQTYLHTGQYQKCIDLLEGALATVRKTGDLFFMTEVPEYIAKSYEALGQYDSAYKYMEINWKYSDSLFQQSQDQALEDMKSKYESDKKDQVIDRQESERKYGIALFIAACMLAMMFYWRFINNKKMNKILSVRNKEKDFLLKEIHHRVKNNLQILSSLLNLQAEYIQDKNAFNAITEGRNRVQSMAFIHQQLYTAENVTAVDMKEYLANLCSHLSDSFSTDHKSIDINYDIAIEKFDVETAIPLGLIVNELITNSIKYAFRNSSSGSIMVRLWQNSDDQLCLLVKDDGEGLVANDESTSRSFGTDLVKILSQKLKGQIEIDGTDGYATLIRFDRFELAA